ncbi:MAG: hypothetical protein R2795_20845 [Saprospiraceae bacterium]
MPSFPDVYDGNVYSILSEQVVPARLVVNDTLGFIYDEPYHSVALQYQIRGNDGTILYSNNDQPVATHYGRNYIQLVILLI